MTPPQGHEGDDLHAAAAAWVVRLNRPETSEADWLEFDSWLWASRENEIAYDAALSLWRELDAAAPALRTAGVGADEIIAITPHRRRAAPWRPALAAGLAAAAALACVSFLAPGFFASRPSFQAQYVTEPGQPRSLTLPDGTRVDLGGGSALSVRFLSGERRIVMGEAEAVFDVAKDVRRPFLITVGDRTVRVVGTQFDVRSRQGGMAVSVARGVVEVLPRGAAHGGLRLTPGQRLDHIAGEGASYVSTVSPDDAFAWRKGRLIYHDRPLAEVVADLNAQYRRPIVIKDPSLAQRRFSGVLVLDNEDVVVRRLTELASVSSVSSKDDVQLRF
jgi:transmembrane sensor